jgi:hypothetical protein
MPKTHCIHGHELTPANTYQIYTAKGTKNGRHCRQCGRDENKDYRIRKPEMAQEGRRRSQDGLRVLCAVCNTSLGRLEPHLDKVLAYIAKYAGESHVQFLT